MVTTGPQGLLVVGKRHSRNPQGGSSSLARCQKRSAALGSLQCNRLWSYGAVGSAKRVLKNVVQIARKPCHGMGTGVVSLLQGFCRVWLSKLHG